MYWDFNRKRYLLEDIFYLYREQEERKSVLNTKRYRYIDTFNELEEIFKNDRYIIFNPSGKKYYYSPYFKKEIIPPEQLEEELEKYCKKIKIFLQYFFCFLTK